VKTVMPLSHTADSSQPSAARLFAGLGLALAAGIVFLIVSFLRVAGDMTSRAFGGVVLDSVFAGPIWQTALARNVVLFILALVLVHAAFGVICWALAVLSQYAFPRLRVTRGKCVVLWCVSIAMWVLIANAALFPHSSLGEPYAGLVRASLLGVDVFDVATILVAAAVGSVVVAGAIRIMCSFRVSRTAVVGSCMFVVAGVAAFAIPTWHPVQTTSRKPNVIIIGIDALRPDAAGEGGHKALAPDVAKFLSKAVVFSDAVTPLARTFPSWVSILTGRNPHTTGAVINLIPRALIHTGETLGDLFRRAGYRTLYSIDETQFSNVDASYGFDEAITPPIGATDFVLSFLGDTPLSNLLVNSPVGAVLFPNLYANRGAAATYDPDQFVRELDRRLRFEQPTFLALHLTLSHWPYSWATSPGEGDRFGSGEVGYPEAVGRVDQQFQDVLSMLERHGALTNALVIVLSDHGEGLGQPGDFPANADAMLGTDNEWQTRGHGTSILSIHQYHTVLALRAFGPAGRLLPRPSVISTPVSMVDLAPTLTELLALPAHQSFDGRSLGPLLRAEPGADQSFRERIRFTETEFNPRGVEVGKIAASALASAARLYRVDPQTDRIELRPENLPRILRERQYGVLLRDRMLAAIPSHTGEGYDLFTLSAMGASSQRMAPVTLDSSAAPELQQLGRALEARFGINLRPPSAVAAGN